MCKLSSKWKIYVGVLKYTNYNPKKSCCKQESQTLNNLFTFNKKLQII